MTDLQRGWVKSLATRHRCRSLKISYPFSRHERQVSILLRSGMKAKIKMTFSIQQISTRFESTDAANRLAEFVYKISHYRTGIGIHERWFTDQYYEVKLELR